MLAGKDVIAKAPTGTGKTMAFGIPIIERIDPESEAVQAVILAPTRELAMQITEEMREVAVCHEGVRLVCLYGRSAYRQADQRPGSGGPRSWWPRRGGSPTT